MVGNAMLGSRDSSFLVQVLNHCQVPLQMPSIRTPMSGPGPAAPDSQQKARSGQPGSRAGRHTPAELGAQHELPGGLVYLWLLITKPLPAQD